MNKVNYFNLIDFGSSKIRFSVFDSDLKEKFSETKTVTYNNENYVNHFDEIRKTVKKAEKKISFHINDIILILDSPNLFTVEISLKKNLDKKSNFEKIYNALILELYQLMNSHYDNQYLAHIIFDKCIIDNVIFEELPKEKVVNNDIKIDFKIICFPKILIKRIKDNFIKNNLNIINIYCSSYIKSKSYLKKLNRNKISFLEIGWERSSLMFYEKNKFKFIHAVPIGGFHITKDISKIFKLSIDDAEKIKKLFNQSETEFSYKNSSSPDAMFAKDIINKNISIDILKQVVLYRVQEIIDLLFKKSNVKIYNYNLSDTELFLIGEGSILFNNNSFYLNDNFNFKSINFYAESDIQICNSGLIYHINNYETPKITKKKLGLFERFFNYFSK